MIDIFEGQRERNLKDRKWIPAIDEIVRKPNFNNLYVFRQVYIQEMLGPAEGKQKVAMTAFLGLTNKGKKGKQKGAVGGATARIKKGKGEARLYLLELAANIDRGLILRKNHDKAEGEEIKTITNPPGGDPAQELLDEIEKW